MLLGIAQSIATLLAILLFYIMDFALIRRYDKQRQASGSGRSWDFTFFIFVSVAVLVLQPILFPSLSIRTTQLWGLAFQLLGVLLIVAALALHVWSRAARQEEDLLTQTLPGYADYARQTPRFLPRLRRNR